jgi:hypothetical protein
MQPGELLKICAEATKFDELEKELMEGFARLFAENRNEFRIALTALFATAATDRQALVQQAGIAVQKVRKARETLKPRAWGKSAEQKIITEHDPHLKESTSAELGEIKDGIQAELGAVLRELDVEMDDVASKFAALHLECMSNARAIVEYHTGFTLHTNEPRPPKGETKIV